ERGEQCVLVTRDEPVMVDSRALYLGYSPGRVTEHPRLRIVRMPPRLPNDLALAPGAALVRWLTEQVNGVQPDRIVFDALDALSDYTDTPRALQADVARFLRSTGATSYVLARADREANVDADHYRALLD